MRFTPSLRSFPNIAFQTVPMFVWLTMAFSHPFKKDRLALPLSTPLSSRRSVVRRPWLCARRLCLKLLNTWDRPRSKPLVRVALPASLSAQSFKFGFNFSTCQHARRVGLQAWHYMALFRQSGRDLPCDVFQMAGKGLKGLGYVFHFTSSAFSMTDLT